MFTKPSLLTRIAVGKILGFIVGLIGFMTLPLFDPEASTLFRWGILLWYTTVGAFIGIFGVINWHPMINVPMPWWFRAPYLGAWMNFVLTFFIYDEIHIIMTNIFGSAGFLTNPFWFVLEGALVGLLIGYFSTRFGSEGKQTIEESSLSV